MRFKDAMTPTADPTQLKTTKGSNTCLPSAFPDLPDSNLFRHQSALAKLPVPPLQETIQKYLGTLLPILSAEDYSRSLLAAKLFLESAPSSGSVTGPELQRRLEERAAQNNLGWLLEWWNDLAYLTDREPVVFYVNYFFGFKDAAFYGGGGGGGGSKMQTEGGRAALASSQTGRAALLAESALHFHRLVCTGALEPDRIKDKPLCSHMYKYLFNACRIPRESGDTTVTYSPSEHRHIVVMHRNRFFAFDAMDAAGLPLSARVLCRQLDQIVSRHGTDAVFPIGALTASDRDAWSQARKMLFQHPQNGASLETIQSAIFMVCLDEHETPQTLDQAARTFWHGDGKNRFFDKSGQFIVTKNGKAGFNGEVRYE